jgi:hypothetical protein
MITLGCTRRLSSLRRLAALIAALPVVGGCYQYVPLQDSTPAVGQTYVFEITDRGRVALGDRFGASIGSIEGVLQAVPSDEYVLKVYRVTPLAGETAQWSGETTRLPSSYVGSVKGREFSKTRTTIAAVAAAAATGILIGSTKLVGSFSGPPDEPQPPKPANNRVPRSNIRIPIVLRLP